MTTGDLLAKLRATIKDPHTLIHKLNLSRILLCLPPKTDSPSLYLLGLSRYAEIFYSIEASWLSIIGDPVDWISQDTTTTTKENNPSAPLNATRIQNMLRMLYTPELPRTKALEDDLRFLSALCPPNTPETNVLLQSLKDRDTGQRIGQEIRQRIQDKPHILVAYVWLLYSALLYGGRDIRALLLKAGSEFWGLSDAEISSCRRASCPGLSFWHVDDGGGEVKARLRARLADVERVLSAQEQQDILDEAGRVFGLLEMLTRSLDEDVELLNASV